MRFYVAVGICAVVFTTTQAACTVAVDTDQWSAAEPDLGRAESYSQSKLALRKADGTHAYRIVAANLSTGSKQSYDAGEGTRILQALTPDLALVQELNYGSNDNRSIRTWVDAAFGSEFSYVRESGVSIPNAVVSRFPIRESGVWPDPVISDRSFVWARTQTKTGAKLLAVSVHLSTRSRLRAIEAESLRNTLEQFAAPDEYVVVAGDFNADSPTELSLRTLEPLANTGGLLAVDENGNRNTNSFRNKPYDQVLLSPTLAKMQLPVVVGGIAFPSGLVFDTRKFSRLRELKSAQPNDSGGPRMQHMAVVRDVAL
jgi:endonuclease/exonuclease/phosphatase family metal-dependent hydrolase